MLAPVGIGLNLIVVAQHHVVASAALQQQQYQQQRQLHHHERQQQQQQQVPSPDPQPQQPGPVPAGEEAQNVEPARPPREVAIEWVISGGATEADATAAVDAAADTCAAEGNVER